MMKKICYFAGLSLLLCQCKTNSPDTSSQSSFSEEMLLTQRADSFELDTDYEPVPGDSLSHHASGFAKILCSAVFITGLDFEFAAENIGYFTAPHHVRSQFERTLDLENKAVYVTLPNGVSRTAKYFGDQGCICLPEGKDDLFFTPHKIVSNLPDAQKTSWPMGDVIDVAPSQELDQALLDDAAKILFDNPENLTAAFVVTHRGQLVKERYRTGIDSRTRLESWSMGKSLTATLMGVLINQGVYRLDQPAPIPEWYEQSNDPRQAITIADILRMSSGLRFRAPQDPDFDPRVGYPDHIYVYTGGINSFHWAATRPQQWPPNTVGRYRNSDPVLINYLVRLGVEKLEQNYWNFPQTALFDKIGVRHMTMETDPYGNFLLQGYEFGSARDWARLGNLYLNDGKKDDIRILPEGFVDFVSSIAPAWHADGRDIYGGFFWINGDSELPIPKDAYFMAGAGGQFTYMIPSHELVIVIMTHYKGGSKSGELRKKALALVMESVS